jgi:hypothetical protein
MNRALEPELMTAEAHAAAGIATVKQGFGTGPAPSSRTSCAGGWWI